MKDKAARWVEAHAAKNDTSASRLIAQLLEQRMRKEAGHDICPEKFYKYRSLSEISGIERTICHNELYFPTPSEFNDPFDCSPPFSHEASDNELLAYLRKSDPQVELDLLRQMQDNPKEQQKFTENFVSVLRNGAIGVLCLSALKDNILMWSHYADSHKGICIEFNGHNDFFARAQVVKYHENRPQVNRLKQNDGEQVEIALLTKSSSWEYEHEWRIIEHNKGSGIHKFPPEALTGVILGASISSDDEEKVIGWLKERKHLPCLYKAKQNKKRFSLKIEKLPFHGRLS